MLVTGAVCNEYFEESTIFGLACGWTAFDWASFFSPFLFPPLPLWPFLAWGVACFDSFNEFPASNSKNMENGGNSPEASLTANFNSMHLSFLSSVKKIFPPSIVLCKITKASFNVLVELKALQTFFIWDNATKPEYLSPSALSMTMKIFFPFIVIFNVCSLSSAFNPYS